MKVGSIDELYERVRSVQELPGCECFPDSAASVFGASIGSMPDVLTT